MGGSPTIPSVCWRLLRICWAKKGDLAAGVVSLWLGAARFVGWAGGDSAGVIDGELYSFRPRVRCTKPTQSSTQCPHPFG